MSSNRQTNPTRGFQVRFGVGHNTFSLAVLRRWRVRAQILRRGVKVDAGPLFFYAGRWPAGHPYLRRERLYR